MGRRMSHEAEDRLKRWSEWLPEDASDEQVAEMIRRWERGVEPPGLPFAPDWPDEEE